MVVRNGVQFRWENRGFRDFADFLATFNHDKRKKVKQERRRVAESGIVFARKVGAEISASDWAFFYRCYERTYLEHHSTPYLSQEFFERIGADMPDHLMLALGSRNGAASAPHSMSSMPERLWGRYWGTLEAISGLHFEACYYQAIDFCIERGIGRFEGGAQGVHKLARGLIPVTTWSAHAIADPQFARAIAAFCARERVDVAHAIDELDAAKPFRSPTSPA
jgi:predicted N-acyltransferase